MEHLNGGGAAKLSELLLDLYAPRSLPSFRRRLLKTAHQVFDGEMVCHNEINLSTGQSLSVLARPVEGFDCLREAFFTHVQDHPSIQHLIATDGQETTAVKTSDFVTQRKWRGSGLYREFYRELDDIRYQLTIGHKVDGCLLFFAVSRKNCDFSEQERTLLTLLRPHFVQAYENARIYSALEEARRGESAWSESSERPGWLRSDREGRILAGNEAAWEAIERWFPEEGGDPDCLPQSLCLQLRRDKTQTFTRLTEARAPFYLADQRGELDIRMFDDSKNETCELIFLERLAGNGVGSLRSRLGLSKRETDVLRWVVEGKTNREIALILGLSLSTVKTHMSSILRRLGVETRTAAVSRAMELTHFHAFPADSESTCFAFVPRDDLPPRAG